MPQFSRLSWHYDPPLPGEECSYEDEVQASSLFMQAAAAYAEAGAAVVEMQGAGDPAFDPNEFARASREANREAAEAYYAELRK